MNCVLSQYAESVESFGFSASDYENFFTYSLDLFCIADINGYLKKVNPAVIRLLGYSENEILSQPYIRFVHPDDREIALRQSMYMNNTQQVISFQNRLLTKDGRTVWLLWNVSKCVEKGISYLVAKDITKEKEQEEMLRLSHARLKRAKKMARLGSWEYDLVGQQTIYTSDEVYSIYGITREQYPEFNFEVFLNFVVPEEKEVLIEKFNYIDSFSQDTYQHRIIRPDGKTAYLQHSLEVIRENGIPVVLHGIVQDITERKEAELKIEESEKRFRSLVHYGFDMITIIDLEGNYKYNSESMYRILGYSKEEIEGKNCLSLIHPDDLPKVKASIEKLYHQPFVDDVEPFRFRNRKGEWRWLEATGANMMDIPAINGIVVNSRDITDKKILQEKLAREIQVRRDKINKAAIQAQEMERSQLSRELHDNVNQVLTTIKLYTELVLDNQADPVTMMQRSRNYITDCINEIRSISKRLSTPTLGNITLEDSICELANSLNITGKLSIDILTCKVDKKIRQEVHLGIYRIVQEHLTNVIKHAEANRVQIELKTARKNLILTIVDDGKGFDLSAKRKGIGISNMHGRAENINAILKITSSRGKGCTMKLSIPI